MRLSAISINLVVTKVSSTLITSQLVDHATMGIQADNSGVNNDDINEDTARME